MALKENNFFKCNVIKITQVPPTAGPGLKMNVVSVVMMKACNVIFSSLFIAIKLNKKEFQRSPPLPLDESSPFSIVILHFKIQKETKFLNVIINANIINEL